MDEISKRPEIPLRARRLLPESVFGWTKLSDFLAENIFDENRRKTAMVIFVTNNSQETCE